MAESFVNPAWMPSSVSEAVRAGTATGQDLASGAAWSALLGSLERAAAVIGSERVPRNPVDTAAGFRHLLVLLALGIDEVLRGGSGLDAVIRPASTDNVLKWGMDCPDAAYSGTPVRGDHAYRITGNRGTARYVGLQANSGMAATANLLLDEIDLAANGDFELTLSPDEVAGNWLPLAPDATMLIIRQFFYDWDTEVPARLTIERITPDPPGGANAHGVVAPDDAIARQLQALGAFVEANLDFFLGFAHPDEDNGFLAGIDRSSMGAAAENRPVIGAWRLAPDEALVIEVTPPTGLYWGLSLGNPWWETIDYASRQTSLNGHQAVIDADGVFRAVVAHRDPGVANWLDTAGHSEGPMILRCVRTNDAPVPKTRVVAFGDLAAALPPGTARATSDERARTLAARRAAVARRFAR